jgi:Ser/Thr protein kinase RdoA (MazF antagonist)
MECSEALLEFAQFHLGNITRVTARGWKHQETGVWELASEQGRVFLKSHKQNAKFEQELRAYLEFVPHALKITPALLASDKFQNALLLSAVPGELVDDLLEKQNIKNVEFEVYHRAGQFLRSYHDVPYEDTETPSLEDAFWLRAESWLKRAEPFVAARDIDWVRTRVKEMLPTLKTMKRVPCHRDYTGRNWLWHEKLYVIDFEHSRPDVWLFDLEKVWSEIWPYKPELKEAFMTGYGKNLTSEDEALLNGYVALSCITKIVWTWEHDKDEAYIRWARGRLERLRNTA